MRSAIVTGGGKGIGKGCVRALARSGYAITVVDLDRVAGEEAAREAKALGAREAVFEDCDVRDAERLAQVFEGHVRMWGGLDVAICNAGIGGETASLADSKKWKEIIEINLQSQMEGARLAVRSMQGSGSIILVASFGAVYPMPFAPAYAASKAGALHFVRSLAAHSEVKRRNLRVLALCPSYVETPMVLKGMAADAAFKRHVLEVTKGKLIGIDAVGELTLQALADPKLHGQALLIAPGSRLFTVKQPRLSPYVAPAKVSEVATASEHSVPIAGLPKTFRALKVVRLSDQFRDAVRIVMEPMPQVVPDGHVVVRRLFCGVNASDSNFSAGRYFGKKAEKMLPFGAGFECVGVVVARGAGAAIPPLGSPVATLEYGAFSEYGILKASRLIRLPEASGEMVALLTSGLTASIALEVAGMKRRKTVLVTAAAGGTGQFAVQLAKVAGKHVIATCGTPEKADLLRSLGADRIVQYKGPQREDLGKVLRREYKRGVDLVYDGVGGQMFENAVNNLAIGGKLLVIGQIGGGNYTTGWKPSMHKGVNEKLLWKSGSVEGFFLLHHAKRFSRHLQNLVSLYQSGQLKVAMDPTNFEGLESVVGAVEHLHSGRSQGKVVVNLARNNASL